MFVDLSVADGTVDYFCDLVSHVSSVGVHNLLVFSVSREDIGRHCYLVSSLWGTMHIVGNVKQLWHSHEVDMMFYGAKKTHIDRLCHNCFITSIN